MKFWSDTFPDRRALPTRCAFGRYRFYPRELPLEERFELSDNRNPHLAWDDVPEGTKSFAILCHDPDAPSDPTNVNVKDRVVPRELGRTNFQHWVLIDLPSKMREIEEGSFSEGIELGGKKVSKGPHGTRQGLNDYTSWFADDKEMQGKYYGYDGPCPPWNDELIHWYVFTLYALDTEHLSVGDDFTAADAISAMKGHILSETQIEGFYYIYPEAKFGERAQTTQRSQPRPPVASTEEPSTQGSPTQGA